MDSIGVLGLGRMGLPVALRFVAAGYPVCVFDPDTNRVRFAESHGAVALAGEYEVASRSDILVTVLPGPPELRSAMLGPGQAVSGLEAGACWIDLTSNDPRVATEVAAAVTAVGALSLGAPMAGGPADAAAGTLRFYIGGSEDALARAAPVLEALGDPSNRVETGADIASGYVTKLLANTLWFGQVAAVTEALLLGQALGLDLETLRGALETSAGGSHFMTHHLDALLRGDYMESFGIDRIVEELDTVTDLAAATETPAGVTGMVATLHREASDRFGPVDGELLVAKLLEQRAGQLLRAKLPRPITGGGTSAPQSESGQPES